MRILAVNTGSSSVRLTLFERIDDRLVTVAARTDSHGHLAPDERLIAFLDKVHGPPIDVVVHRVVHGGPRLTATCELDAHVEREIARLAPLAPLHNPLALAWVNAASVYLRHARQVAVFDTAWYANLPPVARTYALPRELSARLELRRYGFHGIAHRSMWRAWRRTRASAMGRVISFQLGSGCSVTAIVDGQPVDTSMGFTPLEGLMMATRAGDLDPGLLIYLQRQEHLTPDALDELLTRRSGLAGVSGLSGDMRELLGSSLPQARLAVDLYCRRARKYLGAYLAELGGADAVLFGGGVGENAPEIRRRILAGMHWCGIGLDEERNAATTGAGRISAEGSRVEVWVTPPDEAGLMAEDAVALVAGG
jgi:acetate kinase